MTWGERLGSAIADHGRLCAGIDPHPELLTSWGLSIDAEGVAAFTDICVEAFVGHIGVVKPQVAFFERFGSAGVAVLERAIGDLRAGGVLVIADAKRGDIGSTMDAYAHAWLDGGSPLSSDAVTVSPYLGFGALAPALTTAAAESCGVFVLARTSNPDGGMVQTAHTRSPANTWVAQAIVDDAAAENHRRGDVTAGLVVGATRGHGLNLQNFSGPILAPGLGAQGATAKDLAEIFVDSRKLLLPSSSRDILRHGPNVSAVRGAASAQRDEIEAALA